MIMEPINSSLSSQSVYINLLPIDCCQSEEKLFFLSNCNDIFFELISGDFLLKLQSSSTWRLYVPEVIFGYLQYNAEVQAQSWNDELPTNIIESLRCQGKICILRKDIPIRISEPSGGKKVYTALFNSNGLLRNIITLEEFDSLDLLKSIKKISSSVYSEFQVGTPIKVQQFSEGLQKISQKLKSSDVHFELVIRSSDKLTDLWYINYLWKASGHKIHATKQFTKLIQLYVPELSQAISCSNDKRDCRFHYDCCQYGSNEDCVPEKEWAVEFDVQPILIGWKDSELTNSLYKEDESIQLDFVHDLPDFGSYNK